MMASQANLAVIRMGDVVREEASRRGVEITDEAVGGMAHREREIHGPDIWARRTVERAPSDRIVIDGIRSLDEVACFRETFGDALSVVAVHASPHTRYRRIAKRQRRDDVITEEELRVRDRRELRWGLGEVIALSDYLIVNEGTLEDFREATRRVLREVFG